MRNAIKRYGKEYKKQSTDKFLIQSRRFAEKVVVVVVLVIESIAGIAVISS